jgi:thiol-disulfide isomerase/thioredoxin
MKKQSFALLLGWTLALAGIAPAMALDAGQPAPEFNLGGLKGPVASADLKGKVTYVDFWASWCGPCKQSFPWLNEMQAKYGAKGFQVIGINLDKKRADADKFLAETPATFSIAFDATGDTPKRFEIKGMPSSVLVGPDGKVIATHNGFREEERKELEERITRALSAK